MSDKLSWIKGKWRRIMYLFCVCAVLTDICYSFVQHYNETLDGDMGESVLPLDYIKPLYHDPVGVKMLVSGEPHAAPNRFFSHYLMYGTYRTLPFLLQNFTDPIHSLYYSNAICKTAMQIMLVLLLSCIVCGGFQFRRLKFVLSCLFFSALMQTCGFTRSIGLIDPSITYSFFYALPLVFLLLYLLPFIFREFYNKKMIRNKVLEIIYSLVFLVLTCFSGAINPAVALVLILVLLIRYFVTFLRKGSSLIDAVRQMPSHYYRFLLPLGLLSLYSLYLGTYNTMWQDTSVSLSERYALLPQGFMRMFITYNGGFGILFLLCVINYLVIRFSNPEKGREKRSMFLWILCFSVIYIVLLPFGGYRPYRPYIIRYDTIMPISCLLIFYYVYSSIFLLRQNIFRLSRKIIYGIWTAVVVLFFFLKDTPRTYRNNLEMAALKEIQASPSDTIMLSGIPTSVISWEKPKNEADSEVAGRLLKLWKVTDTEKRFYFPPQNQ